MSDFTETVTAESETETDPEKPETPVNYVSHMFTETYECTVSSWKANVINKAWQGLVLKHALTQSEFLPYVALLQATEGGGEVEEAEEEDRPDSAASKTDKKEPKVTNQFNFSERSSQTPNNPLRVGRKMMTSLQRKRHLISWDNTYSV